MNAAKTHCTHGINRWLPSKIIFLFAAGTVGALSQNVFANSPVRPRELAPSSRPQSEVDAVFRSLGESRSPVLKNLFGGANSNVSIALASAYSRQPAVMKPALENLQSFSLNASAGISTERAEVIEPLVQLLAHLGNGPRLTTGGKFGNFEAQVNAASMQGLSEDEKRFRQSSYDALVELALGGRLLNGKLSPKALAQARSLIVNFNSHRRSGMDEFEAAARAMRTTYPTRPLVVAQNLSSSCPKGRRALQ